MAISLAEYRGLPPVPASKPLSFNDAQLFEALGQFVYGIVHLLLGVGCHQRYAYQCVLRGTGGRYDRVDENTFVESHLGHHKRLVRIPYIERDDG